VELERSRAALTDLGFGLCAVSYDSAAVLRSFAERRGITFPLLADPESILIRQFDVLARDAAPGSREDGMAQPGMLVVDESGIVIARFFENRYYHRMTLPTVLARLGNAVAATTPIADGAHVEVRTGTTSATVHPGNRVTLLVDVIPCHGVHVYAPSVADGYQGLDVHVDAQPSLTIYEPSYPAARPLTTAWTDEALLGYTSATRVGVDVALGTNREMADALAAGRVTITGTLRFQACDARACWAPEAVPLEWTLALEPPDLERAPEALRRR
jgi:hypothetical protein